MSDYDATARLLIGDIFKMVADAKQEPEAMQLAADIHNQLLNEHERGVRLLALALVLGELLTKLKPTLDVAQADHELSPELLLEAIGRSLGEHVGTIAWKTLQERENDDS